VTDLNKAAGFGDVGHVAYKEIVLGDCEFWTKLDDLISKVALLLKFAVCLLELSRGATNNSRPIFNG